MVVVGDFNGWLDLGLAGGRWRKRETERKRDERWKRRKIGSLYYFNKLYAKIEIKMLSEL